MNTYGYHRKFNDGNGKSITMNAHLKIGELRIHFELDKNARKVYIGYSPLKSPQRVGMLNNEVSIIYHAHPRFPDHYAPSAGICQRWSRAYPIRTHILHQ
jgi:hypothetical protein